MKSFSNKLYEANKKDLDNIFYCPGFYNDLYRCLLLKFLYK